MLDLRRLTEVGKLLSEEFTWKLICLKELPRTFSVFLFLQQQIQRVIRIIIITTAIATIIIVITFFTLLISKLSSEQFNSKLDLSSSDLI